MALSGQPMMMYRFSLPLSPPFAISCWSLLLMMSFFYSLSLSLSGCADRQTSKIDLMLTSCSTS